MKVGEQYEWSPYGKPGWPHAYCKIEIVEIVDDQIRVCRINDEGEPIKEENEDIWVEVDDFLSHVKLIPSKRQGID